MSGTGSHSEAGVSGVGLSGGTRKAVLGRAGVGALAFSGAGAFLDAARALASSDGEVGFLPFVTAQECLGVTFLTHAVRHAPGTPSAQFLPVLKAANTTEFDHVRALEAIGGRPLTRRFWIPDAAFGDGGAGLFAAIEAVETIEISLYLVGVTMYARRRMAERTRLCAEALGTEAEHRVLARFANAAITHSQAVPNNVGFEPYFLHTTSAAKHALEALGIGYDRVGAKPGKFYEYPGNPLRNGTGIPVESNRPT